jgi:hypothetical protein
MRWSLWNDLAEPEHYIEKSIVEPGAEHQCPHERVTVTDLEIEQRVGAFVIGKELPTVSHLIYTDDWQE